jgi:hypothetical protein
MMCRQISTSVVIGVFKDYRIGINLLSTFHRALRSKNKYLLVRNGGNVSEYNDLSTRGLLLQLATTIKFQLSVLA